MRKTGRKNRVAFGGVLMGLGIMMTFLFGMALAGDNWELALAMLLAGIAITGVGEIVAREEELGDV